MKLKFLSRLLMLLTIVFLYNPVKSQSCSTCSISISGNDTASYVINAGETFCIDSFGVFKGTLTLNGGFVCNKGVFSPKSLSVNTGTITNHSIFILDSNTSFSSGASIQLKTKSISTVKGNLTINGAAVNNSGIMNVKGNIIFNSGVFSNSAIVNCKVLSGTLLTSVVNSGIINKD